VSIIFFITLQNILSKMNIMLIMLT